MFSMNCRGFVILIHHSSVCLHVFRFLYSDEVQIGPETVMTTLYTAKKYAVPALEAHCVEFLKKNLRADNAFMLLTQVSLGSCAFRKVQQSENWSFLGVTGLIIQSGAVLGHFEFFSQESSTAEQVLTKSNKIQQMLLLF